MEACLEEMRLANAHLEVVMAELQERLLEEQRATTREKAQERLRAKLAPAQKTLSNIGGQKISRAKGKELKRVELYRGAVEPEHEEEEEHPGREV